MSIEKGVMRTVYVNPDVDDRLRDGALAEQGSKPDLSASVREKLMKRGERRWR